MKYTLDLLPLKAFQGRGTPVGGRSLRLHGGDGGWYNPNTGVDSGDYGYSYEPSPWSPPPEPAPAPWSPPPEAAPEPAPAPWSPPPEPAPAPAPAPANQWEQTVNDIYQQEFGRQADASGMATFTALLNQGLTGEQMREALRTSEEGQSYGLSPAPAPVPPLTAANWEFQPPSYDDFGGTSPASWANSVTGERRDLATPTNIQTVRDESGNVSYVNADTGAAIDTKQLDKNITGYDKEITSLFQDLLGRTPSASEVASYNQQIQSGAADLSELVKGVTLSPEFLQAKMPFLDPNADVNTKFEQGVRGFDAKGLVRGGALEGLPTHYFDPQTGKLAAWFGTSGGPSGTDFYTWHTAEELKAPGAELRLAEESKRDVGAEWRDLGRGALKVGATVLGGYLAGPAAGLVEAGVTTGSVLADAALKSAAMNALTTVASGGSATDVLKAGVIGAVSGAAGSAIGGINGGEGLGTFGNALAKAGVQTGLTALTGGNVPNALIASAINTALPMALDTVIPKGMFDGLPDGVKNSIVNTASRALTAAATGGDVSDAVLKSILNIAGNTAKAYSANANNLESATTGELGFASGDKGAGGNLSQQLFQDAQSRNDFGTPLPRDDVVNSILQQDAQDVMNRNVPPPLVQAAIDQNTPRTAENVVIPPLIQQATGQSDPDAIYNQLVANAANPTVGAPLSTLVSATTSDINTPTASAQIPISKILEVFQQTNPDATMSDLAFQDFVRTLPGYERTGFADSRDDVVISPPSVFDDEQPPAGYHYVTDTSGGVSVKFLQADVPNAPFESGFKPQLPAEEYAPMLDALNKAGETVTQKNLEDITQDPAKFVSRAFQAFLGRLPTSRELANYVDQYSESHTTSPQDLLKNIYDQIKSEYRVFLMSEPVTQAPQTPKEVAPVTTPTASASSTSQGNKLPERGLGTQGAAAAGNEGAPGAVSPSGAAALTEAQNIVSEAASSNNILAVDIPIATERVVSNSETLGTSPAQAVASGLVNPDGSLTAKGVQQIADATGLSPSDVVALTNGATTARTGTGSGITSTGAGATAGAAAGAALAGTGIGGSTGTNTGGLGTGTGTGVGPGTGTGTGEGLGDGLGLGGGSGSGSGTGTGGAGTGGVKPTVIPTVAQPSYSYSGAGSQGTTVGALPGNLQATFLQGANVDEYNPFENYNVYQQLGSPAPVRAAQGGSPLQLAQLQQGVYNVDPSLYSVLQKRAAPNYFTYGQDASGGNPTTFAGSQMMGKPMPGIPVIPTGQKAGSDWLYQGSGTNPLAMAGTGIPSLPGGMMAHGGQAHGGEGEHIPEFITGATGHYVRGRGDGQSDDIPAMLADGEYVFDAETVAQLGNGSSDAGAAVLDKMRESIRRHKRSAPIDSIPPKSKSPLEYLAEASKGKRK